MKKIHSSGHSLVYKENTLSFKSFSVKEDQTYYYQYNGENLKGISKELYMESKFGLKWSEIINQLSDSNLSHIEDTAKCWINEAGKSKLMNLKEYYKNTFGADWKSNYDFEIVPKYKFSDIEKFITCNIQNETICLAWPHDIILHFNEHGDLVQHISLETNSYLDTLYHICSDGQFIWGVSPTMNTVVKYSFPSFKVEKIFNYTTEKDYEKNKSKIDDEIKINFPENRFNSLDYPEYISSIDGQLYVCDMENKRIVKFNPNNGEITPYINLESKPFEFLKWNNQLVIQSETGIYLFDDND